MTADLDQVVPPPPKSKVKRYLFALVLSGLAVYFFLPRFTAMGYAFLVISNLKIPFVVLSVAAQVLSYVDSSKPS
jgi:hypothetical protein